MPQLNISTGTSANDGLGTNFRTAWYNTQTNFTELYSVTGLGGSGLTQGEADALYYPIASGIVLAGQTGLYNLTGNERKFATSIPTGIDLTGILYTSPFSSVPVVTTNLQNSAGISYSTNLSGVTSTGFFVLFSDIVLETGVVLHTVAKI